jgi:hypothetical protein
MTLVDLLEAMQGVSMLRAEELFEDSIVKLVQAAIYSFLKLKEEAGQTSQAALLDTLGCLIEDSVMCIQHDMRQLLLEVLTPCTRRQVEMLEQIDGDLRFSATQGVYPPAIDASVVQTVQNARCYDSASLHERTNFQVDDAPIRRLAASPLVTESKKSAPEGNVANHAKAVEYVARRGSRLASSPAAPDRHRSLPLQCLKVFVDTDWFLDTVLRESLDLVLEQAYGRVQAVAGRLTELLRQLPAELARE